MVGSCECEQVLIHMWYVYQAVLLGGATSPSRVFISEESSCRFSLVFWFIFTIGETISTSFFTSFFSFFVSVSVYTYLII